MNVIKRNGARERFKLKKIEDAILAASKESDDAIQRSSAHDIALRIKEQYESTGATPTVEEIHDSVERELMNEHFCSCAQKYIRYRYEHEQLKDPNSRLMKEVAAKLSAANVMNQNANVDEHSFGGRRGEAASEVTRQYALDHIVSDIAREMHTRNLIYIHDLDSYAVGMHNCDSIPFDDLLAKGFNTRQADVRPANSINTAFQLVAVIFQLQSLQQFGGCSATHLDWTMVPYVRKSFRKHYIDGLKFVDSLSFVNEDNIKCVSIDDRKNYCYERSYRYGMEMTERELRQAVEGMYHNLNIWATKQ